MNRKILIVGGTGFIGQRLVERCLLAKFNITTISKTKRKNKHKSIHQIYCDISKKYYLHKALNNKKFDYVVNLAGYVDHSKKIKTIQSHYNGCKNLAEYFKLKNIKKFIQIGSSVEYGKVESPQTENKKVKQKILKSNYGLAKFKATDYLLNLNKKTLFPVTVLRFFLVYGPGQAENRLIPYVVKNSLNGNIFEVSSGVQLRDFLFIDDAVEAIIKTLNNKKSNGEIINICSGRPIQIKKLITYITNFIKKGKPIYGKIKLRRDEPLKLYSNHKKATQFLRWRPKIKLIEGLKKTIRFYEKNFKI